MTGNCHISCGAGEKLEITSNAYLLLTKVEQGVVDQAASIVLNGSYVE